MQLANRVNGGAAAVTMGLSQLRDSIGGVDGRHNAYAFVTQEFKAVADNAYYNIGCPAIDLTNAWNVFTRIVDVLRG